MTNQNKFYALVLETPTSNFLSVQYAESLEEAFAKAREEYLDQSKGNKYGVLKIGLFVVRTLYELTGSKVDEQPKKQKISEDTKSYIHKKITEAEDAHNWQHTEPAKDTNELIKEVIKNPELLEKRKGLFTKAELKYIKEQIKKNVNNSSLDNKNPKE